MKPTILYRLAVYYLVFYSPLVYWSHPVCAKLVLVWVHATLDVHHVFVEILT